MVWFSVYILFVQMGDERHYVTPTTWISNIPKHLRILRPFGLIEWTFSRCEANISNQLNFVQFNYHHLFSSTEFEFSIEFKIHKYSSCMG